MNNFEHVNAASTAGAVRLLEQNGSSRAIAGGTDLLSELKLEILSPDRLVNLKSIPGLDRIQFDGDNGIRIGALCTLDEIAGNEIVRQHYPLLFEAVSVSASPQLRNMGTIGGNLNQDSRCWYYRGQFHCWLKGGEICYARDGENERQAIFGAGPCYSVHPSDPAVALAALDAEVRVEGPGRGRSMLLEDFFRQPREGARKLTALGPAEIVTGISIPLPARKSRSVYLKAMGRKVWSFALASLALQLQFEGSSVSKSRIVLGGVAPKPWRMPQVEEVLQNRELDNAAIMKACELLGADARPLTHNGYKIPLIKGLLQEALRKLMETTQF